MMTVILFLAAVIPPLYLGKKIYEMDLIEKEPVALLRRLFLFGAISGLIACLLEIVGDMLIGSIISNPHLYILTEVFIAIALVEEVCKYYFLKRITWKSSEFNYLFDAVVYSTVTSLGFAALENIFYVSSSGLGTAFSRALLSIPGHCIFGIYMGIYYGLAREADYHDDPGESASCRKKAILVPMILHGIYDYLLIAASFYSQAVSENTGFILLILFGVYVVVLDIVSIRKIKQLSREDRQITAYAPSMEQSAEQSLE